ncbi:hypothetical protein CERSUDRAFT_95588 [Gelatoporia subvermispora B]|uniref:Uncharacterized protein n=1 Tax=Ceriporiopsis subvermispora (strain B) TaxID=914234 RepID=M2PJ61_CERS8|nr:hypothetical protein CERSUDRAFT_95588 [Gelatoporia subvermispora B]
MSTSLPEGGADIAMTPDITEAYAGDAPALALSNHGINSPTSEIGLSPYPTVGSTSVSNVPYPVGAWYFNAGIPPGQGGYAYENQTTSVNAPYAGQGSVQAAPFQQPAVDSRSGEQTEGRPSAQTSPATATSR